MLPSSPINKAELIARVNAIAGLTIGQGASLYDLDVPNNLRSHKGWFGHLIEKVLGADAGSLPIPDFPSLGIELKTLPIGNNGKPCQSTFVASISLTGIAQESWQTSVVKKKLNHVLWLPMEGDNSIPLSQRRIGLGFLWQPNIEQEKTLQDDWLELSNLITMGNIEHISAHLGEALQIRPKAANGKILTSVIDKDAKKTQTLPRGFYLRSSFTQEIYLSSL